MTSNNLAKICFWLIENKFAVLIAAYDTFRAGAVEQRRTLTKQLNSLHPPQTNKGAHMVQLYEKGYGKDAAGVALEAINHARDSGINVVLVDTAGRMHEGSLQAYLCKDEEMASVEIQLLFADLVLVLDPGEFVTL